MGLLSNIKEGFHQAAESIRAANEQKRLEEMARRQRLAGFLRGYDVFPPEITDEYARKCKAHYIKSFIVKWIILAVLVILTVYFFITKLHPFAMIFTGMTSVVLFFMDIYALTRVIRMILGDFDVFGGMITNKRVEEETSTDSDGNTSTTYTYFISLNGIESEVSSTEYRKADIETYCFFVRFTAKYIRDDKIILYPCPQMIDESTIIGQHRPINEIRLYSKPRSSPLAIFFGFVGITAAVVLIGIGRAGSPNTFLYENWMYMSLASAGVGVLALIMNSISVHRREKTELEEKQRRYDRQ